MTRSQKIILVVALAVTVVQAAFGLYRASILNEPYLGALLVALALFLIGVLRVAADRRRIAHVIAVTLGVLLALVGCYLGYHAITGSVPIGFFITGATALTFLALGIFVLSPVTAPRPRIISGVVFIVAFAALQVFSTLHARFDARQKTDGIRAIWH